MKHILVALWLAPFSLLQAAEKNDFEPLDAANLDQAVYRQWVAGEESPAPFRGDPNEISVPLSVLHWNVKTQPRVRADIGVLRGANGQTTQRVYWSNKATTITADVPSEAELTPKLWGQWKVR